VADLAYEKEIEAVRKRIDAIDEQIMKLLSERVEISKEAGKLKRRYGRPVLDQKRESEVYAKTGERARRLKIDPEGSISVFERIVKMCRSSQEDANDAGRPQDQTSK
jgi:chorismate mutase